MIFRLLFFFKKSQSQKMVVWNPQYKFETPIQWKIMSSVRAHFGLLVTACAWVCDDTTTCELILDYLWLLVPSYAYLSTLTWDIHICLRSWKRSWKSKQLMQQKPCRKYRLKHKVACLMLNCSPCSIVPKFPSGARQILCLKYNESNRKCCLGILGPAHK